MPRNHWPRSTSRQRCEQNGNASGRPSSGFLQVGQRRAVPLGSLGSLTASRATQLAALFAVDELFDFESLFDDELLEEESPFFESLFDFEPLLLAADDSALAAFL